MYSHIKTISAPLTLIRGLPGSGKAQPLDALIKVPNGWSTMGQMQIGTDVIAKDGSNTKVNGVFPQGLKEVFKITFADGRSTECCADHLWCIIHRNGKDHYVKEIIDTKNISEYLQKYEEKRTYITLIDSEQNIDVELPLDPYLLGVFLGDGSGMCSVANITTPDKFVVNEISKLLPIECMLSDEYGRKINSTGAPDCYSYSIIRKPNEKINTFTKALREMNLFNKLGHDKFIPEEYLHASSTQRLHMLQGLLDTDGTIGTQGTVSFSTSSEKLSLGVQYLVRSLGGIAKISTRIPTYTYLGNKLNGRLAYQVNIRYKKQSELFRLPKKKERTNDNNQYADNLKLRIDSIESIGFKETQCISIEHPDHLYVTDQFIVTHNTTLAKKLQGDRPDIKHFEADMYFMVDGVYVFNHEKIKNAHEWCRDQTRQALLDGHSVIVSNTFVRRWEMENYIAVAKDPRINCVWHILTVNGSYPNVHNVPDDVIQRMKSSWED